MSGFVNGQWEVFLAVDCGCMKFRADISSVNAISIVE